MSFNPSSDSFSEMPARTRCISVDEKSPVMASQPTANEISISEIAAPFRGGDNFLVSYNDGSEILYVNETGMANGWVSYKKDRDGSDTYCESLDRRFPFGPDQPVPSDPSEFEGLMIPSDIKPGDKLHLQFSDGHIIYELSEDCETFSICVNWRLIQPIASVSGVQCDPSESIHSNKSGDPTLHFEYSYLLSPTGNRTPSDQTSDEAALPAYDSELTSTSFAGTTFEDGDLICHEILDGSDRETATVLSKSTQRIELLSICDSEEDPVVIDLMDESGYPCILELPDGTSQVVTDLSETVAVVQSLYGYLDLSTDGSDGSFKGVASPILDAALPKLICKKVLPFVKATTSDFDQDCITEKRVSGVSEDGVFICSNPRAPEGWEQYIQLDGQNPDSFNGGLAFVLVNGDEYTAEFASPPMPGSVIRNCIRQIGTTDEFCDEKTYPNPSIVNEGGEILLSNTGDPNHDCYVVGGDTYNVTVTCYNLDGELTFQVTETYNEGETPSLTGSCVTARSDKNFTYDDVENIVEVILEVTHNYVCEDNPEFNTSLTAATESYTISIADSGMTPNSVAINLTSDINGAAPSEVVICDDQGQPVITFSNPHVNGPNNYPGDGNSSYPLPEGTYYPKIDGVPGSPFCIKPWTICDERTDIFYNGLTSGAGFNFELPIDSTANEIQFSFLSLTIPDQFIVTYNGQQIFDSGQVSTGQTAQEDRIPFTYVDGVDTISVEIIPDPTQPSGTVTIYSLSIGCCVNTNLVELPFRDPYFRFQDRGCTSLLQGFMPYVLAEGFESNGIVTNVLETCESGGCLFPVSEVNIGRVNIGTFCASTRTTLPGCRNNSVPTESSFTEITPESATFSFTATSHYEDMKNYLEMLMSDLAESRANASVPPNDLILVALSQRVDVQCGGDGNSLPDQSLFLHESMFTFDDATETITINVGGFDTPEDCCGESYVSDLAATLSFLNTTGQTNSIELRAAPVLAGVSPTGLLARTFDYNVNACGQLFENTYYVEYDPSTSQFSLYLGSDDTGELVMSQIGLPVAYDARMIITIANEDGLTIQDVDYETKSFDMSYYGGSPSEMFVDGSELSARITVLTGVEFSHLGHYEWFIASSDVSGLRPITCS